MRMQMENTTKKAKESKPGPRRLLGLPGRLVGNFFFFLKRGRIGLRNSIRRLRRAECDYVFLTLGGSLPERSGPPRRFFQRFLPFPEPPLSMQALNARLWRISQARNVRGVILIFTGFSAGLATLQNVRRSIARLRAAGKEVIVYTPYLNVPNFLVACAADRIIVPEGANFEVLGLRTETLFLKDALQRIGVKVDVLQISPYKTAGNVVGESNMTPEQEAQLNWLLDDRYDQITADMASGRGLDQSALQTIIDQAPFPAAKALEQGLVDHVAYQDELARLLAPEGQEEANFWTWPAARRLLLETVIRRSRRFIGVVSLEGSIVPGPSRQSPVDIPVPFIGGNVAGEETLTGLLRRVEKLPGMAALILHVDSPGGVALPAELIGRQVARLAQKMPVLVYMGNVAASGGYYVAAPGQHIMCQPGTLTGSIGILSGRANTDGLYNMLQVNRTILSRGARAGLYADSGELSVADRTALWDNIVDTYNRFKQAVAEGRNLPFDSLDEICEGRIWTGRQAQEHQLVDSFGDFIDAISQVAEMAGLPAEPAQVSVANFFPAGRNAFTIPQSFPLPQEFLSFLNEGPRQWLDGRSLALMPFTFTRWW
jgi:protease-4